MVLEFFKDSSVCFKVTRTLWVHSGKYIVVQVPEPRIGSLNFVEG
jgi:hypothetical protein